MAFVRKDGVDQARVRYRRCDGEFLHTTLDRVVVDDIASGLPVREFRWYKGRRHYSGWYYSSTVEGLVAYESRLELARIMLADFDRDVIALAAQPFQLVGPDGARIRRHVPDNLLVNADGSVMVVDVKAPSKVEVLKAPILSRNVRCLSNWASD
ncbi:TnsA-like heteromeric transposase endonuclease subunit [Saccharopolyspora hattusasensis]|uniref:TnsA-like heteromeric transposase endonuclease subunit n=1 Tax=Saccharopolyspora hattusasensis TaxID=1128679 RepID=UPI003D978F32